MMMTSPFSCEDARDEMIHLHDGLPDDIDDLTD